jgi:hypothetical protein
VLGGRSGVIQPGPERVESRQPSSSRDVLGEIAGKERVPLRLDPAD